MNRLVQILQRWEGLHPAPNNDTTDDVGKLAWRRVTGGEGQVPIFIPAGKWTGGRNTVRKVFCILPLHRLAYQSYSCIIVSYKTQSSIHPHMVDPTFHSFGKLLTMPFGFDSIYRERETPNNLLLLARFFFFFFFLEENFKQPVSDAVVYD